MSQFFPTLVLIINTVLWCIEWDVIVGYRALYHEYLFIVSFAGFLIINLIQFLIDCLNGEQTVAVNEDREKDRLAVIVGIGASLLLSLSILASLPVISQDTHPILRLRFHWAALASFLWIVFGVFWVTWVETSNDTRRKSALSYARRIKTAALSHALGWAGTAAIMLISSMKIN